MLSNSDENLYRIGITGHRDLLPTQKEENIQILKGYLLKCQREHPDRELIVLTPLADGADRLIVEVASMLGIAYEVILPMPKEIYKEDFFGDSAFEFERLLCGARSVSEIGLYAGNTTELIQKSNIHRSFQYRQVGRRIVEMSDEMIVMSDGVVNHKIGGTEDIANYAVQHDKITYRILCQRDST